MIYIFFFLLCFIIDKYLPQKRTLYKILVFSIYVFLCFGYMTGSDWRNYELIYENNYMLEQYKEDEPSYVFLVKIFNPIIRDFWIFNGLMKCFYLYSLMYFFHFFSKNKWTVLAISFTFSSLFMLIDCPMRFMIAMAIFLFACRTYLKKKYVLTIILCVLATTCHVTMIIPILIMMTFRFANLFCKLNNITLICIYIITLYVSKNETIYNFIFSIGLRFLGLEQFNDSIYTIVKSEGVALLGALKTFIIFIILLWNRKAIIQMTHGYLIFYMSCLYFLTFNLLSSIPAAFRMGIFMGYFVCISFSLFFIHKEFRTKLDKFLCKYALLLILLMTLWKDIHSSYKFYPYTNSIPYILTEHLPYIDREKYNLNEFEKLTGKSAQ